MMNMPKWIEDIIKTSNIDEERIKEYELKVAEKLQSQNTRSLFINRINNAKEFILNGIKTMDSMGCYPIESYDPPMATLWVIERLEIAIRENDFHKVAALATIMGEIVVKCQDCFNQILENYHDQYLNR